MVDTIYTINIERLGCVEGFTPLCHAAFATAIHQELGHATAIEYNGNRFAGRYERSAEGGATELAMFSALHRLCLATGQDCVACVQQDLLTGARFSRLVGPRAHLWMPFKPELFHWPKLESQ